MIVKVSISFLNDEADAVLLTTTDSILAAMTNNASYPNPSPSLPDVTSARNDFSVALSNAANGGKLLTAIKNEKRVELAASLRPLASYVQVTANGDLPVLISSGFPIQKPERQPIGVLPAPSNLTVTFGARSGELRTTARPLSGAGIYNWRLTTAAEPTVVLQTAQTTAASKTFTGLTPGVVYRIEVNAVGAAGPSNWSEPVSQIAV
jgi:hypothetical protein